MTTRPQGRIGGFLGFRCAPLLPEGLLTAIVFEEERYQLTAAAQGTPAAFVGAACSSN